MCTTSPGERKLLLLMGRQLEDGMIDIISSDHSPGATQESAQWISEDVVGNCLIQNTLLALYSEGVCKARLSLERMAQICAVNPAQAAGN